jgi:hypothetical protein
MTSVVERYHLDFTPVRQLEALFGERLPDLSEPLRLVDADVDRLRDQLDEYTALAAHVDTLHQDLSASLAQVVWDGDAADQARSFWDAVLTVLKWIAAIILFIVAIILVVIAFILIVIGELCRAIGVLLSWVAAIIAVVVVIIALIRTGGRGQTGRLAMLWAMLKEVFNSTYLASMGIVGALCQGIGWLFDVAGRGVMWLALYLMEVASKLTDSPYDKIKEERDKQFG